MSAVDKSIAKQEARLLSLATAYKGSSDARARNMIRGKAQRLVGQIYSVPTNRDAVWLEWCALAEPNPKAWLRYGN
jgi:hypothetical protein